VPLGCVLNLLKPTYSFILLSLRTTSILIITRNFETVTIYSRKASHDVGLDI
jgi:hypothetical protein